MTHEEKSNAWVSVLQPLVENGSDGLGEMLSAAVNFAMELERERHPEAMRRRLRTSNAAENLHLQIRRRTRVAGLFPNEESLLRLVSAISWRSARTGNQEKSIWMSKR